MFSDALREQSENKFLDIIDNEDPIVNMLVPFWVWQAKQREVYALLSQNSGSDYIDFNFQLLRDCLPLCNCMLSAKRIEITPKCIPIHKISSFFRATRRIFMSATLVDDSAFVTALGLKPSDVENIISPEKANDIGDRLILFPQVMNKKISDEQIKLKLKEMSETHNVVVIVPSYFRAEFWRDVSNLELSATNITEGVAQLKAGHVGLTVLINKYDGIDLPDSACRILVIDGLPKMRNEYDSFEQNANPLNRRLCSEQIQKIEQGMGRGVRSNSDYSVVILLGRGLADIIYSSEGIGYFSDATKAQFQLSEQLWDQLKSPSIDEVMGLADYSLSRDMQWVSASKDVMSNIKYSSVPNFNPVSTAMRTAFDFAESGQYQEAVTALTGLKNKADDIELRGILKQYIAEYTNFFNPEDAQQILLSAHSDNRMVLRPIRGIQFEKVLNRTGAQSQFLIDYISEKNISPNSYILKVNAILEKLTFSKDTSKGFESAVCDISFLLGIYSNRPEDECGKGPDNFWDIGNSTFFVVECKNGTVVDAISKHDCNQLNGSINWFESMYRSNNCVCYPIMIHNSRIFEYACSPHERIRIMTPDLLLRFKANIAQFAENLVKPEVFNNAVKINQLLDQFKLLGTQIVDNYTTTYTVK